MDPFVFEELVAAVLRAMGYHAKKTRDSRGDPIGVALFFTSEELSDIGVNTVAADSVELHVEDGEIRLVPICLGGR